MCLAIIQEDTHKIQVDTCKAENKMVVTNYELENFKTHSKTLLKFCIAPL